MPDRNIELTRRKILAGLGAVGAAGAGAGLGTTALFSDEESFVNNSLTAGTLDLHVGWEEHYFGGVNRTDFSGNADISASDVQYVVDSPGSDRVTLPLTATSPADGAVVSVPDQETALDLLDVTEVDEWPAGFDAQDVSEEDDPCTYLEDGSEASPVIVDLEDVKPGDFGEITFSLALCDNPGYLWAKGCLQDANENDTNEPEASASGETDGTVELLDAAQAALWYDDGDNLQSGGTQGATDLDVVLTLDNSNSVSASAQQSIADAAKTFVDLLSASSQSAAVSFADGAEIKQSLTTNKSAVKSALDDYANPSTEFGTEIGQGIETAQAELTANGNTGADDVIVVLSDGEPFPSGGGDAGTNTLQQADNAKAAGTRILSIGFELSGGDAEAYLKSIAGTTPNSESDFNDGAPYDDEGDYFAAPTESDLESAFGDLAGEITGAEEVLAQGSLRDVLDILCDDSEDDLGLPLDGDGSTAFDEVGGDPADPNRDPFAAGTRHDFGFAWWVPRSVGNEIQSDSATFSLAFHAVQSRNNDGSGSPPDDGGDDGPEVVINDQTANSP